MRLVRIATAAVLLTLLVVGPAAAGDLADLALTTAFPVAVLPGENITYTITVENLGPSPATDASIGGPEFLGPIPAGTTFVSFTTPAGWTTTITPPVGGTGGLEARIPSLAVSMPQIFTLVVRVDATHPAGAVSSSVGIGSITVDPDILNNFHTADTYVAGPVASLPSGAMPERRPGIPLTLVGCGMLAVGLLTATARMAKRRRT